MSTDPIFIASYPRSGNTLLRTVLFHCFGLHSGSVYPNDLGGNTALEQYVGHLEQHTPGNIRFPHGAMHLLKTHEAPMGAEKAIYIVRDGRAVSVSLWEFYKRRRALSNVISGQHRFGIWSDHILRWHPWERPNTLLVRYEEILSDLPKVLAELSEFLDVELISDTIPERKAIAGVVGRWVRQKTNWVDVSSTQDIEVFDRYNAVMMKKTEVLLG